MKGNKKMSRDISKKNYKYIYNIELANYMMINKVMCKGTGKSQSTGNTFWCFDFYECQPIYDKWNLKVHGEIR